MFRFDDFHNGCTDDQLSFMLRPEPAPDEAGTVSQSSNADCSRMEFRTSIADDIIRIYTPLRIGDKTFLYREERGCYSIASDAEVDSIVEKLIDLPANNSQAFTASVRHEIQRRRFYKTFSFNPSTCFVNFSDTVFDLKTERKDLHDPSYCFNYVLNCSPFKTSKDDFKKSVVRRFLLQICEEDGQKFRLLQEHCGVLLTGLHCKGAFFWIGVHDSGKSTLANLLRCAIGENNASAVPFSQFDAQFSKAKLCGSRINIGGEFNQKSTEAQWNFFKEVTGGDVVSVEEKYCDPVHMVIQSKLLFLGNFLPHNMPDDDALYDRIKLLEFSYCVPKSERDPELQQKLYAEKDIFAWWALKGAMRYLKKGYRFTELPDQTDIRMIGNPIARFLSKTIETATSNEYVPKIDLYTMFSENCLQCSIQKIPTKQQFYKELKIHFPQSEIKQPMINGKKQYVIYGIRYKK